MLAALPLHSRKTISLIDDGMAQSTGRGRLNRISAQTKRLINGLLIIRGSIALDPPFTIEKGRKSPLWLRRLGTIAMRC